MSELTTGWGLLIVGFLAWVAISVPVALAVGHIIGARDRRESRD